MPDLILRAIKTTDRVPLDEEWEEVEEEATEPPKPSLFSRTKAAIKPRVNLETTLSKLRAIEQHRLRLIEWDKVELQAANALLGELESEIGAVVVSRDGDLNAFRKSYHDWLGKHISLSPQIKALREWIAGLSNQATLTRVDDPGNVARLKIEHPELKKILADCICGRAAQLKTEAEQVEACEQKRLDTTHGKGEYEASEEQVVKRARANCEYVETMAKRIMTEPVESCYLDIVRYLFR